MGRHAGQVSIPASPRGGYGKPPYRIPSLWRAHINRAESSGRGSLTLSIHVLTYAPGQVRHFAVRYVQDPVFDAQRFELLLLEGHAVRQRGNMPVNVAIALLASQRKM